MYLPSAEVLKLLGYRTAKAIVLTERNPEEKLFVYILINAIEDVMVHQSDRKSSLIKCEAHNWLIGMSEEFCNTCEFGLLNPIMVQSSYQQAIKDRKIKFTQRQIQWKKYHNTYKTFKKSDDKEKRRNKGMLRRLRQQVLQSSTSFVSTLFLSVI